MKNNVLLPVITAILGFSFAWLVKPNFSSSSTADTNPSADIPTATVQAISVNRDSSALPARLSNRPTPSEKVEELPILKTFQLGEKGNQIGKELLTKQQQKMDLQIARLVSDLNLTPEQEAELRALWQEELDALGGGNEFKQFAQLSKLLKGNTLENTLTPLLTEEQKGELAEINQKKMESRVEAKALKGLADLSFLNMRPEQKDAVMDMLYEQAEEAERNPPITKKPNGIEINGIPVSKNYFQNGGSEAEKAARAAEKQKFNDAVQKRINDKVNTMRPFLDEEQLERYHESLQGRDQQSISIFK